MKHVNALGSLQNYEKGSPFAQAHPDLLDGLWLQQCGSHFNNIGELLRKWIGVKNIDSKTGDVLLQQMIDEGIKALSNDKAWETSERCSTMRKEYNSILAEFTAMATLFLKRDALASGALDRLNEKLDAFDRFMPEIKKWAHH